MGGQECLRIVQTKPGRLTGETLYQTEDGQWWTSEVPQGTNQFTVPTGETIRYVRGDRMCVNP